MAKVEKPMTFNAANRWLAARVNVPTTMGSAELALSKNFQSSVKAHAFFSAKVAETRVLEKIRNISDQYSSGTIGLADARTQLKTFLGGADDVAKLATPPAGVSVEAWKKAKGMSNIASTARLNLILRQNAAMAHAVGQREVSMHPDMITRWPYFLYQSAMKETTRETHALLNGTVLPKDDPFWHTHTPPWAFSCICWLVDIDKAEAADHGGINKATVKTNLDGSQTARVDIGGGLNIDTPASGYVFDVREAFDVQDMSRVRNIMVRKACFRSLSTYFAKHDDVRFNCVPGTSPTVANPLIGEFKPLGEYIEKQSANFAKKGVFLTDDITAGTLSHEITDGLGMAGGKVFLSEGTTAFGLKHAARNHTKDILDGEFLRAIKETLFASNVNPSLHLTGRRIYLNVHNKKTGAWINMRKFGDDDWQVVSAYYPEEGYAEKFGILEYEKWKKKKK